MKHFQSRGLLLSCSQACCYDGLKYAPDDIQTPAAPTTKLNSPAAASLAAELPLCADGPFVPAVSGRQSARITSVQEKQKDPKVIVIFKVTFAVDICELGFQCKASETT